MTNIFTEAQDLLEYPRILRVVSTHLEVVYHLAPGGRAVQQGVPLVHPVQPQLTGGAREAGQPQQRRHPVRDVYQVPPQPGLQVQQQCNYSELSRMGPTLPLRTPGPCRKVGTLVPPSNNVPLVPLSGKFEAPWLIAPPLSEVNTTRVSLYSPAVQCRKHVSSPTYGVTQYRLAGACPPDSPLPGRCPAPLPAHGALTL